MTKLLIIIFLVTISLSLGWTQSRFTSSIEDRLNISNVSVGVSYSKIRNFDYINQKNYALHRSNYYKYGLRLSHDINKYVNLGFMAGNIETNLNLDDIQATDFELKVKTNIYIGLDWTNTVRLYDDWRLSYITGFITTLKKDIEDDTLNIKVNKFHLNKFWTEIQLTKEFVSAEFMVGAGFIESNIRSCRTSEPNELKLRLNNKEKYYLKSEFLFEINNEMDFNIGYSFLPYSKVYAGITYNFGTKRAKQVYDKKVDRKPAEPRRLPESERTRQDRVETPIPPTVAFTERTPETRPTRPTDRPTDRPAERPSQRSTEPSLSSYEDYRDEGIRQLNAGNNEGAIRNFEIALNIRPNSIEVHKLLGDTYEKMGNFTKALEHYDTAIRLIENQR